MNGEYMKEKYSIKFLDERLESIEKILKILVVNSLADDLEKMNDIGQKIELSTELKELLADYGMIVADTEVRNGFTLVYIETKSSVKYKVKDYQFLDWKIKDQFSGLVPIFKFAALNGMQRKRFIEENISFCIDEKEIHICARDH